MSAAPVNWDDVPVRQVAIGPIEGAWRDLGTAAGTRKVGLRRIQIAPGKRSTPAHTHSGEEEVFYVLAGAGLSWQGGATCEVAAGDCLVHLIEGPAHTLIAGPDGLDVLAFSERTASEACFLPRAKVSWLGSSWVTAGDTPHPFVQEAAAGDLELPAEPSERPASIVNVDDVPAARGRARRLRRLSPRPRRARRARSGRRCGCSSSPPASSARRRTATAAARSSSSCSTATACTSSSPRGATGWDPEERPVKAGDVVSCLAGAGAAHAFRAGPGGLTYLAYGDRDTNDQIWYPRSQKIWFSGLGVIGRVERTDYWDGEE